MDETLSLNPVPAFAQRLPADRPFTRAMARTAGVERPALERMVRDGTVRRVVRGVYAAGTASDSTSLRAAALALVVGRDSIVVDRTAAWVHGVEVKGSPCGEPPLMEVVSPRRRSGAGPFEARRLTGRDVERLEGLRVTTPLRTALDLGRMLPPDLALAAMDQLLAGGTFTLAELLAEIPRFGTGKGVVQLRTLAVQADARSSGQAESTLRLRWHEANLPTATPALRAWARGRHIRLSLGVERRQFGAVLADQVSADDRLALESSGWRIVVLSAERLLHADAGLWMHHLEREFHQHLLAQIESEAG